MITTSDLPAINAALNGLAAVLLGAGFAAIKAKRVGLHRACMVAAFATSTVFLATYVTHKLLMGAVSTRFTGQGWIRPVYFGLLISHVSLAVTVVPLASVTLYRAARARFAEHRRIARVTFPIWMYVSVTGVLVYVVLYHLYPTH